MHSSIEFMGSVRGRTKKYRLEKMYIVECRLQIRGQNEDALMMLLNISEA